MPVYQFEELEVKVEFDSVSFKWAQKEGSVQLIILWCSAFLFMLFIVSIVPLMQLTGLGNALAVMIGLVVLVTIALVVQTRVRTTTVRLAATGIQIDQGTVLDREVVEIRWGDLKSVELEPVDPKQQSKGMHLEFFPKEGEPVRILPGIGVGDLNGVRQAVLKARAKA